MVASQHKNVAWYAANPGGADFGGFLKCVRGRFARGGQIRAPKKDE